MLGKRLSYIYIGDVGGAEIGVAILAGVGSGILDDFSIARKAPGETVQVLPEMSNTELYAEVYAVFRDLYVRVAPLFGAPA